MKVLFIVLLIVNISFTSTASPIKEKRITVDQSGKGDYKTVQQAFDAVPSGNKNPIIIFVKKGIYKERLTLDTRKDFVTLVGEDKNATILTYNNHTGTILPNGDTVNTWTSASFFIYANDFKAENITFENNAGFTAGQAVAVFAHGDRLAFTNCRFVGFQDVLFCSGPGVKQFYKDCYIEGTTDFIFGPSTAVFQNCHIHSKKKSHVTAASTPREIKFGFVFLDCKLTGDSTLQGVSLGRPWTPYASVAYLRCDIGSHIGPEGWNNWRNPANEQTARYSEYKCTGEGAKKEGRVKWVKELTDEESSKYTLKNIFGEWNPLK
ncbi:MAG: pectin esterase [Cyclobacteriaceae bacterium]|nr:pectin esterase [Cyclobacteriaceae bacterium]